mgnify:CR=1 FL=1
MTNSAPPRRIWPTTPYRPHTTFVRRVARRGAWIITLFTVLGTIPLIYAFAAAAQQVTTSPWIVLLSLPGGCFAAGISGQAIRIWYLRRTHRHLEARNWNACQNCGYDTSSNGDSGTCPECGGKYSASDLRDDFIAHQRQVKHFGPIDRPAPE